MLSSNFRVTRVTRGVKHIFRPVIYVIRYLLWGHAERDGSHVHHFVALHAREAEVEA